MRMAVDIARGTEVIHNIRGGPYTHTDIAIDQYMIDPEGHVLLNDFNRGKFQDYDFRKIMLMKVCEILMMVVL